jgi:flagellar basal body-associated protein FliL
VSAEKRATSVKAPSGRTGIAFSVLAIVLAVLGAGYWNTHRSEPEILAGGTSRVKGTMRLETFVLNLADPAQRSYLRVGIDLGLRREVGRGENAPPVAEVRDTILGVLAQSRVDELLTAKGKTKLKEDLLHALQERIPALEVEEVYFTEFLIQR